MVSTTLFPPYTIERSGTHCEGKWPGHWAHQYGTKNLAPPGFGRQTIQPAAKLLYRLRSPSRQVLQVTSRQNRKLLQNSKYNKFILFIHYPTLSIHLLFTVESFEREGTFKIKSHNVTVRQFCSTAERIIAAPSTHLPIYSSQFHFTAQGL